MLRINLLEWREARREQRKRQFTGALILAVLAGLTVVFFADHRVNHAIQHQDARNHYLRQQIVRADSKIQEIKKLKKARTQLLNRIEVIQHLQKSRSHIVHFFEAIVKTLPDGVYLTSIQQKGGQSEITELKGVAKSSGAVSAYLRNLDHSPWFKDPTLNVISTAGKHKSISGRRLSQFTITVHNASPPEVEHNEEQKNIVRS
jgi:type IV pilus assembly protein PilN